MLTTETAPTYVDDDIPTPIVTVRSKLTDVQQEEAVLAARLGATTGTIARVYGVTLSTVRRVLAANGIRRSVGRPRSVAA